MKKYKLLFFVELYLLITILIYYFGPVNFHGHNSILFFSF